MSVDPFEFPPLVEFENCITLGELIDTFNYYLDGYYGIPKYKVIKRFKMKFALIILDQMIMWIKNGKPGRD